METMDFIFAFESGEATEEEIIEGFSRLIRDGTAWQLQGCYGRTAQRLIESGYIDEQGNILRMDDETQG